MLRPNEPKSIIAALSTLRQRLESDVTNGDYYLDYKNPGSTALVLRFMQNDYTI